MQRVSLLLATCLFPPWIGLASGQSAPGREAIAAILTGAPGCAIFIETTPSRMPGDRANAKTVEFIRRGTDIVGRTTCMAPSYNCEFTVRDSFEFSAKARGCAG